MFIGATLPEFSHSFTTGAAGSIPFFVTTDGKVGMAHRFPVLDAENPGFEHDFEKIGQLIARLQPGIVLKVIHRCTPTLDLTHPGSRREAVTQLGWTKTETIFVIETCRLASLRPIDLLRLLRGREPSSLTAAAETVLGAIDHALISDLGGTPFDEASLSSLFPKLTSTLVSTSGTVDTGSEVIGVLRIWRQGTAEIGPMTLARIKEAIPAPYEIIVTIRKLSDVRAQYILQRKRSQLASSDDPLSVRSLSDTEELAAETTLSGKGLVEIEWLLTLTRLSEADLRSDLATVSRVLARFGDVAIETHGVIRSLVASHPGSEPHHTFLELDTQVPYYLPVFCRGEGVASEPSSVRSLPLHRQDGSIYHFDLWRKGYDGANCIINGRRGKGKSVLANLISRSLLDDSSIRLVKVDVGGSYAKECELAGGNHIQFNLSEPSGLNPFSLLSGTEFLEDASIILSGFLSTLLLESRETVLSKEMQGAVEKSVLSYAETKPTHPTLSKFLSAISDIPRRGLLERFTEGGVFSNVLKEIPGKSEISDYRYTYFNFERLQNASNEDFSQAVMAAVIASVNMEVLKAGDARRGAKNRVVFFADETPFFIQRNGRFFKLTTANFRKFGHATILIAQTTKDFELPATDGTADFGILLNSPIRFFFQVDDEPIAFAERFGLSESQINTIQGLGRGGNYREVFLQDELGGRVLRVAVTPEEYWRVTSTREDNEKLYTLMKAVPGLTLQEAIRCLARV